MTDLTEFLLARVADEEEAARAAGGEFWYAAEVPPPSMRRTADEETHWVVDSPATLITYEVVNVEKARHIARWDPARVLAECEAKRRIVELHAEAGPRWVGFPRADRQESYCQQDQLVFPCPTLRLLALPYASRPDYRQEWRP